MYFLYCSELWKWGFYYQEGGQTPTLREENTLELRLSVRTVSCAVGVFQGKQFKISQDCVTVLDVSSVESVCSRLLKGERISLQ